jgi:hypothetical protein
MLGAKGVPIREWMVFTRRHCGPAWPIHWLASYVTFWRRAMIDEIRRRISRSPDVDRI